MAIAAFYKQPAEAFPIAINFAADLATGEVISSHTVTAMNASKVSTTATVIGSTFISGETIRIPVKAGTSGEEHTITCRITTSALNVFEAEVVMIVLET